MSDDGNTAHADRLIEKLEKIKAQRSMTPFPDYIRGQRDGMAAAIEIAETYHTAIAVAAAIRTEAAKLPEADEIERLRMQNRDDERAMESLLQTIDNLHAEAALAAMTERVRLLEVALRPFATVAERDIGTDEMNSDLFRPLKTRTYAPPLMVGHFRRAAAVLREKGAPNA